MIYRWFDYLRHRARLRTWHEAHALGRRGEDIAHRYLRARGYIIVARNWRTRSGSAEIDIVAWDGPKLVFVEVKTRGTDEFGEPDRAVDQEKKLLLARAATEYLRRTDTPWEKARFDVIAIVHGDRPSIAHYTDAFSILQLP